MYGGSFSTTVVLTPVTFNSLPSEMLICSVTYRRIPATGCSLPGVYTCNRNSWCEGEKLRLAVKRRNELASDAETVVVGSEIMTGSNLRLDHRVQLLPGTND